MEDNREYLKNQILKHIEELKTYIIDDDETPDGEKISESDLVDIDDRLEECINNWEY